MKNKWKNLLAVGCIGVASTGMLAGCSMSADQKEALDLMTDKADDIIELLEDNMTYTRTTLSKEEAAEKILLGRNYWALGSFDQLELTTTEMHYDGKFDKEQFEPSERKTLYKKTDNSKYVAHLYDNEIGNIIVSNFTTDKHYVYENSETPSFEERTYSSKDFVEDLDLLSVMGVGTITTDNIKDIEPLSDGYRFKILNPNGMTTGYDAHEITIEVMNSGYITSIAVRGVVKLSENSYYSAIAKATYKYDNIDFSITENKLAELNVQL